MFGLFAEPSVTFTRFVARPGLDEWVKVTWFLTAGAAGVMVCADATLLTKGQTSNTLNRRSIRHKLAVRFGGFIKF